MLETVNTKSQTKKVVNMFMGTEEVPYAIIFEKGIAIEDDKEYETWITKKSIEGLGIEEFANLFDSQIKGSDTIKGIAFGYRCREWDPDIYSLQTGVLYLSPLPASEIKIICQDIFEHCLGRSARLKLKIGEAPTILQRVNYNIL